MVLFVCLWNDSFGVRCGRDPEESDNLVKISQWADYSVRPPLDSSPAVAPSDAEGGTEPSKLCWLHKLAKMMTSRFPIAVQNIDLPGAVHRGRPLGVGFRNAITLICKDLKKYAHVTIAQHAPDGHECHKQLRAQKLRRSCRLNRAQRRIMAEGNLTFTHAQLTRGIILHSLWTAFIEQKLAIRSRKDKVSADWMRRMITHDVGCSAPFLNGVDRGLAQVLLSARSHLLPYLSMPRNLKHVDRSLAAGAFTQYILRAPVGTHPVSFAR